MSDRFLTSIPSVSWPGLPCSGASVAINDGNGRWLCYADSTPCPANTVLYVSPPEPFVWRYCAPIENVSEAIVQFGPNQAQVASATPVPALSLWAMLVVAGALALLGARRLV